MPAPRFSFLRSAPFGILRPVTWRELSLDWQMTWLNGLAVVSMMLGLKFFVMLRPGTADARSARFLLSPVLSPNSLQRCEPLRALPAYLRRAGLALGALLLCYAIYWRLVETFHWHGLVLSYLAVPVVLLMTETLITIPTLLWIPSGQLLPKLHRHPFAARTVGDFWGRRWNLWVSDWFRGAIFQPLRRRPRLALWLIFIVSGLLHEYVLNLTLWWLTGRNLLGSMMIYFLLQPVGILFERRFLKKHPRVNVAWTWLVVFVPAPLVFHESMLRTLHLWPG